MDTVTGRTVFKPSNSVAMAVLPDGAALLDMSAGKYFGLDPVGAAIWSHIESANTSTLEALASSVSETFDVSAEDCTGDIRQFVQTLLQRGLVETMNADTGEIAA